MAESPGDERQRLLRFASHTAHEVIGPVNQTSSLVALFVRRYHNQLDAEAEALLHHIENAGARLADIAKGLQTFFAVLSSECERVPVDTRAALESALFLLENEIRECQAAICIGELPEVIGDPNLLRLLFREIIANSLKFRRPETAPRILAGAERVNANYRFTVTDNGIGIDPAHAESVFLAFNKLSGHQFPGSGMGLTLAQAIIEMHGGSIWIAKPDNGGTSVIFELPGR